MMIVKKKAEPSSSCALLICRFIGIHSMNLQICFFPFAGLLATFYTPANLLFLFAGLLARFYTPANLLFPFAGLLARFYTPANLLFLFAGLLATFYGPAKLLFLFCRLIGDLLCACKFTFPPTVPVNVVFPIAGTVADSFFRLP
ncbi:hypothetical protein QA612_05815 [Evansella sp. AB-P1]|uniref:hypothetical protein n=1 Tax=Evansella sp. AB-P1 TaxID=3037653 RepID=UPI00241FBAB7|nr:hypothetical protein [Evansella sp. AB-P1]MDG5787002.1 hypothetical protein [Evansella sp. AB-P1]